jgi:hypothetical protein
VVLFGEERGLAPFSRSNPGLPERSVKKVPVPVVLFGEERGLAPFSRSNPGLPERSVKKVPVPGVSVPVVLLERKMGTGTFFGYVFSRLGKKF